MLHKCSFIALICFELKCWIQVRKWLSKTNKSFRLFGCRTWNFGGDEAIWRKFSYRSEFLLSLSKKATLSNRPSVRRDLRTYIPWYHCENYWYIGWLSLYFQWLLIRRSQNQIQDQTYLIFYCDEVIMRIWSRFFFWQKIFRKLVVYMNVWRGNTLLHHQMVYTANLKNVAFSLAYPKMAPESNKLTWTQTDVWTFLCNNSFHDDLWLWTVLL